MPLSRRLFLQNAAATSLAFSGLSALRAQTVAQPGLSEIPGHGPLVTDPDGLFDLPEGFTYRVISTAGDAMSDGLVAAGDFDGMGCFTREDGKIVLVRNHELYPDEVEKSAFGIDESGLELIDRDRIHDWTPDGHPHLGGTSHVILDPDTLEVTEQYLSLAGTANNCAGGVTPWGSWVSCEETEINAGPYGGKEHGYNFEVPASATGLVEPVPLKAMGRFRHEAIAVDPASGAVYQTEDKNEISLFYRFLPTVPGELARGGRLQALQVRNRPSLDTRNWQESPALIREGEWLEVEWVDLDDVEAPDADLAEPHHVRQAATRDRHAADARIGQTHRLDDRVVEPLDRREQR